jgi:serine/threonine protein kinase
VHRDLKLENVLLDKEGNVKLVDFGFTREYEGKASYLQTWCGTVCYSAPEMLRGEKYAGEKVDVWSLGIILFALLKGELPFDEDDDAATKAKILKDEPEYPEHWPEAAKTLISKLLSKRPFPRPSLADILSDPFLSEHAPTQNAILKLSQPAPFTTPLEKNTLERMKAAGVDIDKVIENVLSQSCDSLAGWWALLIEKEAKKEVKREKKRKEREAEMKLLRRLSGASGRFSTMATLEQVDEEGGINTGATVLEPGRRSTSRGRSQRRSTPQILVSDLPKLPEGITIESPNPGGTITPPPPPVDKDSLRSRSTSRPSVPPKEKRRRSSHMQIVATNPDLLTIPNMNGVNGIKKRPGKRRNNQLFNQLSALKHWFVENTRGKSPGKTDSTSSLTDKSPNGSATTMRPTSSNMHSPSPLAQRPPHERAISGTSTLATRRSSYGNALTPVNSNGLPRVDTAAARANIRAAASHRNSLSPSPLTPRSSIYRRSSSGAKTGSGLRGRKSTSSSVSSIRSMPRHPQHSKASSLSSNEASTIHSPGGSLRGMGRSPHTSIKVLPATPVDGKFNSSGRMIRAGASSSSTPSNSMPGSATSGPLGGFEAGFAHSNSMSRGGDNGGPNKFNEAAIALGAPNGVLFAKRKKSAFKGPMLYSSLFGHNAGAPLGSPAVGISRLGSGSGVGLTGLRDLARRARGGGSTEATLAAHGISRGAGLGVGVKEQRRKSNIIEEEEEEDDEEETRAWAAGVGDRRVSNVLEEDDEDEAVEEVDEFSDVEMTLGRGERVDSVVIYDDPASPGLDDGSGGAAFGPGASGTRSEEEYHHTDHEEAIVVSPEKGKSNVDLSAVDGKLNALKSG